MDVTTDVTMNGSDESDSSGELLLENEGIPMDFLTASSLGVREMVRYHLRRGQDINERSVGGWTALMYACAAHKNDLVWLFLNSGADITVVDDKGRHFLIVIAENFNIKALCMLRNWMNAIQEDTSHSDRCEIVKRMINLPEKKYGFTPLMYAAQLSPVDTEMVTMMLNMGADISMTDRCGNNAARLAAFVGHSKTAWLLKFHDKFTVRDILEDAALLKYEYLFADVSTEDLLEFDEESMKRIGLQLVGPRKKLLMTLEKIAKLKMKIIN